MESGTTSSSIMYTQLEYLKKDKGRKKSITRNNGSKCLKPNKKKKNYKSTDLRMSTNLKHEKYIKGATQKFIIIELHRTCYKENILKASRKKKETLQTIKIRATTDFLSETM